MWEVWIYFSFLFWLASRLGYEFEALINESLNFDPVAWSCTWQLALWVWEVWIFFSFSFYLHEGWGLSLKFSETRAWILTLWQLALWVWEVWIFFWFFFDLNQGLRHESEALINESLNFDTLAWSCSWQLALWVWEVWILFILFFLTCVKAGVWIWSSR
jgi:hypothetical protein